MITRLVAVALLPGLVLTALVGAACGGSQTDAETLVIWRADSADSAPRYDIVALEAGTGEPRVLTPGSLGGTAQPLLFDRPSWSPDGERIAFTVELDGNPAAPVRTAIYVMDADGSNARRLTRSETSVLPVWSRNGRTIAFAKRPSVRPRSPREFLSATLSTIGADGSGERELVRSPGVVADIPGSWSPDGRSLAFTRLSWNDPERSLEPEAAIYVVRADGSRLRKLVERASDPAWSPDGRSIAYVSDRDRNGELSYGDRTFFANELYVANADGSEPRRLTRTRDLNERTPAWSPDGTRIAYTRGEEFDNAEATIVLVAEADGECATEVAADSPAGAWYANPAWRPREGEERFTPDCR